MNIFFSRNFEGLARQISYLYATFEGVSPSAKWGTNWFRCTFPGLTHSTGPVMPVLTFFFVEAFSSWFIHEFFKRGKVVRWEIFCAEF